MSDLINSLAYLMIFVSTFICIIVCLVRWNNSDETITGNPVFDGEEAGESSN